MKKFMLNIFFLLLLFNITLLGSATPTEPVETSMGSFTVIGIVIMLVLSSVVGVIFIKEED